MADQSASILEGRELSVSFGGVKALDSVDITIHRGELFGLIGPNGAGKTTLVNAVSGVVRLDSGQVMLDGSDITGWPPWKLARNGITRSFQGTRLFGNLTVRQNLEVAAVACGEGADEAEATADWLLGRTHLRKQADVVASALPSGDQHRVGVLRALATRPRFLLLDEPAAGLNEIEGEALVESVRAFRDELGCGVLVIEHDMSVIMALCERIQVLNYGASIGEGRPDEVRQDPEVIEAYLGTGFDDA